MQLAVGSYTFAANSVQVGSRISTEYTPFGLPIRQTRSLDVSGYLDGSSQFDLTTASLLLEATLQQPNPAIVLYQDSGAQSATRLLSTDALGGSAHRQRSQFRADPGQRLRQPAQIHLHCRGDLCPDRGRFSRLVGGFS